ncbi:MAG: hypothetical protein K2G69_08235 [Muribaculaceae bacterium]|nr:hypothetical protein [Muribaculaceae bacterium]
MKLITKIKFHIVAIVSLIFVTIGCANGARHQIGTDVPTTDSSKGTEQVADSVNHQNDTIKNSDLHFINEKISTLSTDTDNLKEEVRQANVNEVWQWLGIIFAIIEGIIILCLVIILFKKDSVLTEKLRSHDKIIGDLQHKDGLNDLNASSLPAKGYTLSYSDYFDIKDRIAKLENSLSAMKELQPTIPKPTYAETQSYPTVTNKKTCYFGSPISGEVPYFKKEIISKDSDARFKVEIQNDEATFEPFENSTYINTYRSNDALRAVIDFDGDPNGVSSSVKVYPGKARKKDDRWIVIEKAKIKLS